VDNCLLTWYEVSKKAGVASGLGVRDLVMAYTSLHYPVVSGPKGFLQSENWMCPVRFQIERLSRSSFQPLKCPMNLTMVSMFASGT
jgi:hypothetical protein